MGADTLQSCLLQQHRGLTAPLGPKLAAHKSAPRLDQTRRAAMLTAGRNRRGLSSGCGRLSCLAFQISDPGRISSRTLWWQMAKDEWQQPLPPQQKFLNRQTPSSPDCHLPMRLGSKAGVSEKFKNTGLTWQTQSPGLLLFFFSIINITCTQCRKFRIYIKQLCQMPQLSKNF